MPTPDISKVDLAFAIGLPPEEAIAYFESKGFAISFKWQDVWAEAQAKAFTVAGVTKLDVLTDIRGALDSALKSGETLASFQSQLQPLLEAKGWWGKGRIVDQDTGEIHGKRLNPRRLETIFRTNLQSSYMAGASRNNWPTPSFVRTGSTWRSWTTAPGQRIAACTVGCSAMTIRSGVPSTRPTAGTVAAGAYPQPA